MLGYYLFVPSYAEAYPYLLGLWAITWDIFCWTISIQILILIELTDYTTENNYKLWFFCTLEIFGFFAVIVLKAFQTDLITQPKIFLPLKHACCLQKEEDSRDLYVEALEKRWVSYLK